MAVWLTLTWAGMFTLKQLKYFVAVAEHGSVTAAAKALYVSQPGVSAAVAQLEELFDVQLLIRRKARGVELTTSGRALLASARELLHHADDVMTQGRELNYTLTGSLRIGFFHTIGPHVVPDLLARFRQEYSNVAVSLLEGDLEQLYNALMAGDIELAVLYDLGLDDHIERCRLRRLPPYVLVSPDCPVAGHAAVSLRDLVDEPMILLDLPHSREYFTSLFRSIGVEPRVAYRTKSVPMVRSMVANDLGYSVLNFRPRVRSDYDGKPLVYVDLKDGCAGLELVLAWRTGVRLTTRARAFINVAKAHLGLQLDEAG